MKNSLLISLVLLYSVATYGQQNTIIEFGSICNVELKKYGVILQMPCEMKGDSSSKGGILTFKKDYFKDGVLAGFVYITISPNQYKSMEVIEKLRMELLDTYRQNAEELGLDSKLGNVEYSRAQSEYHLHLAAREFPSLQGNPKFLYMYWIDLLLGNNYTVKYEILAPFNERVVLKLRELVRLVEWLPVAYNDTKTGLKMMIPGGDWKAFTNNTGTGVQLKPHYLWDDMYFDPRLKFPEIQILPQPAYSSIGFEKAVDDIKSKLQQKGAVIVEDDEIIPQNATKARFIIAKFKETDRFYDQEYIWLLQLPGNKLVEINMKATCSYLGCAGEVSVLPLLEKVVIESLKY
jgi:hypothetical protein